MASTDIFERLKQDHDRHREMLDKIKDAEPGDERAALFDSFKTEVTAHAAAEEETLYATMLAEPDLRHDGQHSVSEHKELDDLMQEIADTDQSSSGWLAKFKQLDHDYRHHIDEEEEDMFPAAAKELSADKERELKQKFEERKPAEYERAVEGVDEGDDRD